MTVAADRLPLAGRFGAFLGAGAIGFLVDAAVTELAVALGADPWSGRLVGIAVALSATFLMNRRLAFRSAARGAALFAEAARYALTGAAASMINFAVYAMVVFILPDVRPALAVAAGSAVALVASFLGYDRFVFRPGRPR